MVRITHLCRNSARAVLILVFGAIVFAPGLAWTEEDATNETDARIEGQLRAIFRAVAPLDDIDVGVTHGVVRLEGKVPSDADAETAVAAAKSVEGVVYVHSALSNPTAVEERLPGLKEEIEQWLANALLMAPLWGLAALLLLGAWFAGRFVADLDWFFRRVVKTPILRGVARRVTRLLIFAVGVIVALEIIDATTLVGTVLGAAGVLGLAVGLAFRDIAENYLASFLLIGRRPFSISDTVKIGDEVGKVMRLTMRETVLMTFEGNHLSLPNAIVFKAVVLNYSRNPRRRFDFVVGAGVDTDLLAAQQLGVETLLSTPGVIAEPKPWSQIEELGDSNVALRFYGWVDQREADFFKVRSEAIRRVKIAMEEAGVDMPEPIYRINVRSDRPAEGHEPRPEPTGPNFHPDVDVLPDETIDEQIEVHEAEEENLLR